MLPDRTLRFFLPHFEFQFPYPPDIYQFVFVPSTAISIRHSIYFLKCHCLTFQIRVDTVPRRLTASLFYCCREGLRRLKSLLLSISHNAHLYCQLKYKMQNVPVLKPLPMPAKAQSGSFLLLLTTIRSAGNAILASSLHLAADTIVLFPTSDNFCQSEALIMKKILLRNLGVLILFPFAVFVSVCCLVL